MLHKMSIKQLAQRARFWLGYGANSFTEWMLAEGRMPPVRWIPWGLSWCYDLRRCFASAGKTPRMLFDVGANIGQTALHLHAHFPQATIHAFEPVPQTFEMLQKNISEKKHIIACDFALGSENITQHISLFDDSEFNTLKPDPQQTNRKQIGTVEIQIKKLDDYRMTKNIQSVDLLKMDVQGYELEVLEGAKNSLSQNKIGAVYSEVCFKTLSSEMPISMISKPSSSR